MKIKMALLTLNNITLRHSQIHKLRGYIADLFKEYDLIHNHDLKTGKNIYRYPLIQFKIINKKPIILALTDPAVKIFSEIFLRLDEIKIEHTVIPVHEKNLKIEFNEFGFSEETFTYNFVNPWIGLNQKNYQLYKNSDQEKQIELLKKTLIGNILSLSKYLNYWLEKEQRINVNIKLNPKKVNLKGEAMNAFVGVFKTNFIIPDFVGLGKSVSRGFGVVRKLI